jgi:UDP-3-O-[3-hydroxymyristoyl] N-acetylglucosamine deacetylase
MHASRRQRTLGRSVTVSGYGYWSSQDVRVEFRPATDDTGIVFVRSDLRPEVRIEATIENRVEAPRRTTLRRHGASVEMVEHVLAALTGLRIDNCEVWVSAAELPGCDGSSLPFVEALDSAGIVEQTSLRPIMMVREATWLGSRESWIEIEPATDAGLTIEYRLDFRSHPAIGQQVLSLPIRPDTFRHQIAPARTFLLKEEAQWLRSQGLALRASASDVLVFDETGPIDNVLRFPDECVRHKILDILGDFALAGCDLVGQITAHRSGHQLNAHMVRTLLSCIQSENPLAAQRLSA